jgi:hypothetical protein
MAFYVPTYVQQEHINARASVPEYEEYCQAVEEPNVDSIDPAILDGSHIESVEPVYNEMLKNMIPKLPEGNLKELMKLYYAEAVKDWNYVRSVADDPNKSTVVRLYALDGINGGNDFCTADEIYNHKPGTIHEDELGQTVPTKFDVLYDNAPEEVKQDDLISVMKQTTYCNKKRHEWYPLGDRQHLDDMYNFLIDFCNTYGDDDVVILRNDREFAILADFYKWQKIEDKATECCDHVLNRPSYKYTYNPFRIWVRCSKAMINIDNNKLLDAAKELKRNINDYDHMKSNDDFKAMHAGSYYENDLFLIQMLKTYEMLEALVDRDYTAEKELLVRTKKGSTLEEKIHDLDLHGIRHQWKEYVKLANERTDHIGKIRSEQLLSV